MFWQWLQPLRAVNGATGVHARGCTWLGACGALLFFRAFLEASVGWERVFHDVVWPAFPVVCFAADNALPPFALCEHAALALP